MKLIFRIPGPLLSFTGGRTVVEAEAPAGTVGEALAQLWRLYPGLRDRILTEQGQVRPHVNVFVGSDSIRDTGGLATPVGEQAEIAIIPAVSGGAGVGRRGGGHCRYGGGGPCSSSGFILSFLACFLSQSNSGRML